MRRQRVEVPHNLEVPVERLRNYCDPAQLTFETTETLQPMDGTIGQVRAMAALRFGVGMRAEGYNVYAAGDSGTHRAKPVEEFLREVALNRPVPPDWVYVYNFHDPYRPEAISLPPGLGDQLNADMNKFIEGMKVELPRAFESDRYEQRKTEVMKDVEVQREQISSQIQEKAREEGFAIQTTPLGIMTVPLVDGQAMSREAFDELPEDKKKEVQEHSQALQNELGQLLGRARKLEREAAELVRKLDREVALTAVGDLLEDLRRTYADYPEVVAFLSQVPEDIVEHLDEFRSPEKDQAVIPGLGKVAREEPADRYKVNVLVDNKHAQGAPVVVENNPTYYNLIGRIDYRARMGGMTTDFTMIKPGALHRANGGFLVVQAYDLLTSPQAWDALKKTIRAKQVRIENLGEQLSAVPTATLKPEPIPVDVKVVIVGLPYIYHLLFNMDEDFRRLFKVRADFTVQMDRNDEHVQRYANFIASQVEEKGLRHFDRSGVAKVVEYGSRLQEHQGKLSTRFVDVGDIVAEASYWAEVAGAPLVQASHVQQAIDQKLYRSGEIPERLRELIAEGTIMLSIEGAVVGQINGLSVSSVGDLAFGRPSRITARTAFGQGGVLHVERETKLSGRIHDKGVLILAGYLAGKYAQDKPLAVAASITFEQLYEGVEGDSASSTELYALLSSLAETPLRQDLAVTGSVNQLGEVQPIGGVNEKVEGFYDVCREVGLTGRQGVIIPEANVKHLMLREDVVQAVREGSFHIYAVRTIDQGIEVLTGLPAGVEQADGTYPEGTVNYLVERKLAEYAERFRETGLPSEPSPFPRSQREAA
jgi:lon-related putative ATP-dependent protease